MTIIGTGDETDSMMLLVVLTVVSSGWNFLDKASATTLDLPASVMANSSRTYVGACCILGQSFLLKKAIGCPPCCRTAPIAVEDASVSIWKGLAKSGRCSLGAFVIWCCSCVKACVASSVHVKLLTRNKSVSRAASTV